MDERRAARIQVVSVLMAYWVQSGRAAQIDRLNRYTTIAISAVYVLLNGLFIFLATRA